MTPKALFATHTGSDSTSIGLLVLRAAALSLFLKHGLERAHRLFKDGSAFS